MHPVQSRVEISYTKVGATPSGSHPVVSKEQRMSEVFRASRKVDTTFRLILVPSLISLVVTLWRLTGEVLAWSESWFNSEAGGFGAIIGITWLAPLFGVYFARALSKEGSLPPNWIKAVSVSSLAMLILFGFGTFQGIIYKENIYWGLIYIWAVGIIAAPLSYWAWPALTKTLLAYGLAVRIPVIVIMFLATWGQWGTHYDATPPGFPEMTWFPRFLLLGFFPQMLFWVSFTIVTGAFFGTVVAGWLGRSKPAPAGPM
jgi:hypothetical protein